MNIGSLRHFVYADEPFATQSDTGAETIKWKPYGPFACSIEPIGGREAVRAGQLLAAMDTRITVRWCPRTEQITAKWRLRRVSLGKVTIYSIVRAPVDKDMRHREIEFTVQSGLSEA